MASDVEICNLALAYIGDSATVASIDPPEGSAQSEHCARFYPIAKRLLLDSHAWSFLTKRVALAELTNDTTQWQYCYAFPSDCLDVLAILPFESTDDYNTNNVVYTNQDINYQYPTNYTPQEFSVEVNADGNVIYTNQPTAVCRYVSDTANEASLSPTLVVALAWQLASMLAGIVVKGEAGASMVIKCSQMAEAYLKKAIDADCKQRNITVTQSVPWIANR